MENQNYEGYRFFSPTSVDEVLKLLETSEGDVRIYAGGSDIVPKLKAGIFKPDVLISLRQVEELHYISYDEEKGLRIGAVTPLLEIERYPVVKEKYPALYEGCHSIASTQIRNAGTIVGNICNAVPSADSAPGLIALGAKIHIVSPRGSREILVEDLFTGVCRTQLERDELVTEVMIDAPKAGERSVYYPFTIRRALDLAIASVAANGIIEDGVVKELKIALGAVAIKPKRAVHAEEILAGQKLSEALLEEAGILASQEDCAPITDMRATAEYRREIIRAYTIEAVKAVAGMKTNIEPVIEDEV